MLHMHFMIKKVEVKLRAFVYAARRVNSLNTGSVPNTGYRSLHAIMSHFRPLATLHTDVPHYGSFQKFSTLLEFIEFLPSVNLD